jgi:hypothetical protein
VLLTFYGNRPTEVAIVDDRSLWQVIEQKLTVTPSQMIYGA